MHKPHRDLNVWQKSMDMVIYCYEITKTFPDEEKYGLTSQMRRCAVSIPSNIAEGAARSSSTDYARFLTIAIGSLSELDTQLELSFRLKYLTQADHQTIDEQLASISRMLIALRRSIRKRGVTGVTGSGGAGE